MRRSNFKSAAFIFLLICTLFMALTVQSFAKNPPRVLVLATGGTIAGAANGNSATGYSAGQLSVEEIIKSVPGMKDLNVKISAEQVANISSQDMNYEVWKKLAQRIRRAVDNDEADGFVITHGTDTLEETAFFLNNVLNIDNPVVFACAMRPATHLSADGPQNLCDAVKTAADSESAGRGVLLSINGNLFGARHAVKASTVDLQAFSASFGGPLGFIDDGGAHYFAACPVTKTFSLSSTADLEKVSKLPRVDIVYAYAGMSGDLIDDCVKRGAEGIVVAGVGDGNMSADCLEACKKASENGILVVRAARAFRGYVHRDHEFKDSDYGTYASYDLSPQKARILLQLLILKNIKEPYAVQNAFENRIR